MENYLINFEVKRENGDTENMQSRWSGYGEQSAIAQAFLYEAQNGAREIKVLSTNKI
jgi:hypothetical protein